MRSFFLAWTEEVHILQQPVGELDGTSLPAAVAGIPWGHNIQLFSKIQDPRQRLWYAQQTIEHGWSRAVLLHQIEIRGHERQGTAITNFARTLPAPQSDLAREVLKDPYHFDFLAALSSVDE
jgi:predicted nuclease of restriction endonuclease-like (RecB) superfamily